MEDSMIGTLYEEGKTTGAEQMLYSYDLRGHTLLLSIATPNNSVVEDVQRGEAEFALYEEGPALFFLFRFGKGVKWSDSPFSYHVVKREQRGVPDELPAGAGALLKVTLIDANSGTVKAVRHITMSSDFTLILHAAINKQAAGTFNGQSYAKFLNSVWNQYSTEEIVEMAQARFKAE